MKYTESHEWVRVDGDVATVGVSDHAQQELGEIVYVELPEEGKDVASGDDAAVLESTKAAADVYAPISGEIVEVNSDVADSPEMVNNSPQEGGWLFKVKVKDASELDELMSEEAYLEMISD